MTSVLHPASDPLRAAPPLRRTRTCKAIDAGLAVVLIFAAVMHLGLLAGMDPDAVVVFVQALVLSTLLSAVPLGVLWFLDRRERESPWGFAAAFLWGGCIATALAMPVNTAFFSLVDVWLAKHPTVVEILGPEAALLIAAPISAPIAEEVAKALGVLLIFRLLRGEFDGIRDGFVYGALVGVGFNWFEAALYVAQGYAQHGTAPYGLQLGLRYALFGLGGHAMFSALFGVFLGLALQLRSSALRVLLPLVGLMLAILAHVLNNVLPLLAALASAFTGESPLELDELPDIGFVEAFLTGTLLQLLLFVPFLVIIALALWHSGEWERRVIREELAPEVGGAVSHAEYQDILADRVLRTRRIDKVHPRLSAALVNAQNELAFRKHRLRELGHEPDRDPSVLRVRETIRRLREMA